MSVSVYRLVQIRLVFNQMVTNTVQHKTLVDFGTARKLVEKILMVDHTNNSSL